MILTAIARAYPKAGVQTALNQAGRAAFGTLDEVCGGNRAVTQHFAATHLNTLLARPGLLAEPRLSRVFSQLRLGQHPPAAPVYLYQAIHDTVTPYPPVRQLVGYYCSQGATVDAVAYPNGDHLAVASSGSIAAFTWLDDRFAGKPSPTSC
jgi:hypothetical protein